MGFRKGSPILPNQGERGEFGVQKPGMADDRLVKAAQCLNADESSRTCGAEGKAAFHASFRGGFRSTWRKLHLTSMPAPVSPWMTIWAQLRGPSGAAKQLLSSTPACPAVVSKSHRLPFGKMQSTARPSRTRLRRTFGWM